jgi:farnesyl diphosphate synthase
VVTEGSITGKLILAAVSPQEFEAELGSLARRVDQLLGGLLPERVGERVQTAMRYAVLGQGKRLRPFLVVQSAGLFGVDVGLSLRVGSALEALHCYSLIHDDLPAMDNDGLRRGQPTVHRKFDEATAILAGDGLLTFAFEVLADAATHPSANVRNALVLALAQAAGARGMVGGQMVDIEAETKNFSSYAEIAAMQHKKTGALFSFACQAGPIMAGTTSGPLQIYAEKIGLAFQIADDILDVESSAATLGKATQKDKDKGKATFVDLLGLDKAKAEANTLVDEAVSVLTPFGDKAGMLTATARYIIDRRK